MSWPIAPRRSPRRRAALRPKPRSSRRNRRHGRNRSRISGGSGATAALHSPPCRSSENAAQGTPGRPAAATGCDDLRRCSALRRDLRGRLRAPLGTGVDLSAEPAASDRAPTRSVSRHRRLLRLVLDPVGPDPRAQDLEIARRGRGRESPVSTPRAVARYLLSWHLFLPGLVILAFVPLGRAAALAALASGFGLLLLPALWDRDRRLLHDRWTRTRVLREG